jgi:hypothetical protein
VCIFELVLFAIGVRILFRGRTDWFAGRIIEGAAARLIGLLLVLPCGTVGVLGFVRGYLTARAGQPYRVESYYDLAILEGMLWAMCLVLVGLVGLGTARRRPEDVGKVDYKALRAGGPVEEQHRPRETFLPPR